MIRDWVKILPYFVVEKMCFAFVNDYTNWEGKTFKVWRFSKGMYVFKEMRKYQNKGKERS